MTKVEQLLQRLHQRYNTVEDYADLCALAEAGRAEGVAEGAERLQEYTAKYLAEGIKRCNAALAQGRREGLEESAYILAKVDGDHWRFIGLPMADEVQANLWCDAFGGEHVVRIAFSSPASILNPKGA
jgi:hypothetical protein